MEHTDRISELYKGEIFTPETQTVARERIHWICDRVEGRKVVDIGCSQGIVSILLARKGFEVVGVDTDAKAIEYAKADRAKEPAAVQERLTFVEGDIYDIDLPENGIDTVIMGEFLEHLVGPQEAINRAYALLSDGGRLIVTTPFGLLRAPDHKQTFYVASLYKMIQPLFVITEAVIIGRYLCLVCDRRRSVVQSQIDSIDLSLVEMAEHQFEQRELALTEERDARVKDSARLKSDLSTARAQLNTHKKETTRLQTELAKEKRKTQALRDSLSFRLGSALVRPVARPGRFVIRITYRLLRRSPEWLKRYLLGAANRNNVLSSLAAFGATAADYRGARRDGSSSGRSGGLAEREIVQQLSMEPDLPEQADLFRSYLQRFREVAVSRTGYPLVLISSGNKRIGEANRANRCMMFATELAAAGVPVIYVYYRFRGARDFSRYSGGHLIQMPNDFFHAWAGSIAAWNHQGDRLFLCSIPDIHSVAEIGVFTHRGWKVVYEVRDDWEEFHKAGVGKWYDSAYEGFLCKQADCVTAVSCTLRDKMISLGTHPDRTFIVPNGLTRAFLEGSGPSFTRRRSGYRGDGTIGYFGHLTENWFNWKLLCKVASRRKDRRFEIIGFGAPKDLKTPSNVVLLGEKTHDEIIDIASRWSVAMIPFKNGKLAEGVDPIKIYEYLALGLPCVSCWMPQIEEYPLVFTYRDDSEFGKTLDRVLDYSPSEADWELAQAFVSASTWDRRVWETLRLAGINASVLQRMV